MKNTIKLLILIVFFLSSSYPAYACVTTLKWAPPTTGGTPTGYNIYYGTTSGTVKTDYPNVVDAGNVTQYLLKNFSLAANTTYYFRISAYNSLGESEELSNEITYYTDGIAPSIAITSPTSGSTYTTNSDTITISGTASDNDEVSTVIWMLSSSSSSGTASGTTSWSVSNIPLQLGTNTFTVTATDCGGETATDTLTVTYAVEETTTPAVTVPETDSQAPAIAIVSPTSNGAYTTTSGTVSLSGTASDNVGISTVTWANAENQTSGTASGTTSWSISQIPLHEGTNTIAVVATDSGGNASSAIITVTYTVTETATETVTETVTEPVTETVAGDNTDPVVTITSPTDRRYFRTRSSVVDLAGSASDNVGVTTVTWTNAANGAGGTASGTTSWSISGIELNIGRNIITITAYDEAGNSSTDEILVTRRR